MTGCSRGRAGGRRRGRKTEAGLGEEGGRNRVRKRIRRVEAGPAAERAAGGAGLRGRRRNQVKRRDRGWKRGQPKGRGHRWSSSSPAGRTAVGGEAARRGRATGGGRGVGVGSRVGQSLRAETGSQGSCCWSICSMRAPALRPCTGAAQRGWGLGSSRSGATQRAGLRGQQEFRARGKRLCEQHRLDVAVRARWGLDLAVGGGSFFPGARAPRVDRTAEAPGAGGREDREKVP